MILNAILFGVVQGITEFFPISSSGHLLLLHRFVATPFESELSFDVALHLAALLALVLIFRSDILNLTAGWLRGLTGRISSESRLSWFIIVGALPALLFGYFLGDRIEAGLRSPAVVIINLAVIGALMLIPGKSDRGRSDLGDLTIITAAIIGLSQSLAILPGVSRSGITIIAGIFLGLKRQAALKFSFLISIPVLAGASLNKVPGLLSAGNASVAWTAAALGFIAAFLTSLLAIKYLMRLLEKYSLRPFGIYRIALAAVMAIIFYGLA